MLNQVQVTKQRTTFLTPVVPVVADLPMHEQSYTPALLLPLPDLSSAIVCDVDFATACSYGFDDYFESMIQLIPAENEYGVDILFTYKPTTHKNVQALLAVELAANDTTLPFRVGFVFGWLSALSKYQPRLARVGVQLLCASVAAGRVVAPEPSRQPVKQTIVLGTYWE